MAKLKADFQATRIERLAFPAYSMGLNVSMNFINGFILLYFTDFLFLPAAALAVIMLLLRSFDAINDPMFGVIFDKINPRSGKFKPWLRIGFFVVPLTTLMIFAIPPELPMVTKLVFVVIAYVLSDIALTITSTPHLSSISAITGNINERTTIISYVGIGDLVGMIIVSVLLVPQIERMGFFPVAIIVAAVSLIAMALYPFVIKERNRENAVVEKHYKIRDLIRFVRVNKYMLYFYSFICIFGIFAIPLINHVILHGLGSLDYIAVFTMVSLPFLLGVYLSIPYITKKFDRLKLFKGAMIILVFIITAMYFGGYSNPVILGIFFVIRNTIFMASVALSITFAADFVEYGHYKTGLRQEGLTFSVNTFAIKIMLAASGALAAIVLAIIKYDGSLDVQTVESVNMLWLASNGVPVIGLLLGMPLLFKVKFKCSDIQIMSDINAGRIDREEGEALLSRQY